ncbi:MAG: cytochrome c [Anaerolineae bacterium]|nr:cytochrome c [Anaerolineae bacterium]
MTTKIPQSVRWPIYLVLGLFLLVTAVFVIEFVVSTETEIVAKAEATPVLTADLYVSEVSALLENADPTKGAQLVEGYGCIACHRLGAENNIAPAFMGMAERAVSRRLPLIASAYIYESIVNPMAYIVEDYNPAMPQNYPERLTDSELGDIIAYLLTPDAH